MTEAHSDKDTQMEIIRDEDPWDRECEVEEAGWVEGIAGEEEWEEW